MHLNSSIIWKLDTRCLTLKGIGWLRLNSSQYYKTTGNRFCLAFSEKSLKYFLGDGEGNTHAETRRARRKGGNEKPLIYAKVR